MSSIINATPEKPEDLVESQRQSSSEPIGVPNDDFVNMAQDEDKSSEEVKPGQEMEEVDGGKGVNAPRFTYSKEELIQLSKQVYCGIRPKCLDPKFINKQGLWDPDIWMNYESPSKNPTPSSLNNPRDYDQSAASLSNKNLKGPIKRTNGENDKEISLRIRKDPRDRVKDESQDDIVLSPQRRSFGTGCHIITPVRIEPTVVPSSSVTPQRSGPLKVDKGLQDRREEMLSHRNTEVRRVGSGRLLNQRDKSSLEWFKSRDREEEVENRRSNMRFNNVSNNNNNNSSGNNNSNRFDFDRRSSMNNRRYGQQDRRDRYHEEEEPEWFTGGPTSQHDTIELKGFDEEVEEESSESNYPHNHQSHHRHQPHTGNQNAHSMEDKPSENRKTNKNHDMEASPKGSQDFDIDEMFKFEGWKNIVNEGAESAASMGGFGDSMTSGENHNSGGTSRFAQWFNADRAGTESPIDRLLQNATFSSNYNSNFRDSRRSSIQEIEGAVYSHNLANGTHRIDPAILEIHNASIVNNHSNSNGIENGDNAQPEGPVNKGKDLLNLLQRANININDLMQQQPALPTIKFDQVKSVEEIEADLISPSTFSLANHRQAQSHHQLQDANQQEKNNENCEINRLILKAFANRGVPTNMSNPNLNKIPPTIPQVVRPMPIAGKPPNTADLLREEDLLALNQQMVPHESCDPNNVYMPIPSRGIQQVPVLHLKQNHPSMNQRPHPNVIPQNNEFNRLLAKAMTRQNINPNPKAPVILPQQIVRPPIHILGKPSNAMDLLKAEDLLAINQQMIPPENRNLNHLPGQPMPGHHPLPRGQVAPWLHSKPPPIPDNNLRYPNSVRDNSAFMSLVNGYGAINNQPTHLIKAKTEEQILLQQQQQPLLLQAKNKPDGLNGNSPKPGTGNFSAFTPTSVMRKFASEKDKEANRKKNLQKPMKIN